MYIRVVLKVAYYLNIIFKTPSLLIGMINQLASHVCNLINSIHFSSVLNPCGSSYIEMKGSFTSFTQVIVPDRNIIEQSDLWYWETIYYVIKSQVSVMYQFSHFTLLWYELVSMYRKEFVLSLSSCFYNIVT